MWGSFQLIANQIDDHNKQIYLEALKADNNIVFIREFLFSIFIRWLANKYVILNWASRP